MAVSERVLLSIPAIEMLPGDEIVQEGFITRTVTATRLHKAHGLIAFDYTCFGGSAADAYAYPITQILCVRRAQEGSH